MPRATTAGRTLMLTSLSLPFLAIASRANSGDVNVVARQIRSIETGVYSTQARLLVLVVDNEGRGLEGVPVSVLSRGDEVASGSSRADGRLLLDVAILGRVTVRAAHVGFVTAEARDIELRKASFAAVAMPLEVAVPNDPLTAR